MSAAVCLHFQLFVYFLSAVLFTFSAICLQFQLFIYNFALKFLFFLDFFSQKSQLYVYTFSCLFTFSSAVCLLFCQLIVYFGQLFVYNLNFRAKNLGFPSVFCQNNASKFVYIFSCLFTFSAVCLHFQLFVYFFVS